VGVQQQHLDDDDESLYIHITYICSFCSLSNSISQKSLTYTYTMLLTVHNRIHIDHHKELKSV